MSSAIRVLIVEDRPEVRNSLCRTLQRDNRFDVTLSPKDYQEIVNAVSRFRFDAVLLRWSLDSQRGAQLTRILSAQHALPVVVLADENPSAVEPLALREGAVSIFLSPPPEDALDFSSFARALCDHLSLMSQVRIIRRRILPRETLPDVQRRYRIVGVTSSTGGPAALAEVFRHLPADFVLPILLVQHITAEFSPGFVDWLNQNCPLRVFTAESGQLAEAGSIYVGPPGTHLTWDGKRIQLIQGEPECWQCPSGNVLFRSLARHAGAQAIGVLLTGLGEDGAAGLLEMRQAGAWTLNQDRETSAVYGMPLAAQRLGASWEELALDRIGPRLLTLAARRGPVEA